MKGHLSNSHTNSFTFGQRHFRIFPQLIFSYMWRLDSKQPCVYTPAFDFLVLGLLFPVLSNILLCHSSPGGMLQQIDLFGFARTLQAHSAGKRRKLWGGQVFKSCFSCWGEMFSFLIAAFPEIHFTNINCKTDNWKENSICMALTTLGLNLSWDKLVQIKNGTIRAWDFRPGWILRELDEIFGKVW